MLKKILLVVYFLFVMCIFSQNLTVGVWNNKPLVYYENNKPMGFFVDILNNIAQKENWNLEYTYDNFDNLLNKLEEGKIDILLDIAYTPEREGKILYNRESAFTNWGVIYYNSNNKINSLLDLKNKKIAVVKNDVYYIGPEGIKNIIAKLHIDVEFIELNSYEEVMKYVSEKKADAGVISRSYSSDIHNLQKSSIILSPLDVYIGFSKNINPKIIITIDHYIKKWKNDENSIYYELINKYFYKHIYKLPEWAKWFVGLGILIIILISVILYIYKKSLLKATNELNKKNEELESLNEELIAMNVEVEELYGKNEKFTDNLMKMINLISNLKPSLSLEKFYKYVLQVAIDIIPEADYGSIIFVDLEKNKTQFVTAIGHDIEKLSEINSIIGKIPEYEDTRIVKNIVTTEKSSNMSEKDFKLLLDATLPIKETLIYEIQLKKDMWLKITLDISKNSKKHFSEESKRLIQGFGNIIKAFWIEKSHNQEIKDAYLRFATKLSIIAEAHDDITGMHIYRVGKISGFIAEKLGLNIAKEIEAFAPLHDIGKIFVDREILRKPGKLSDKEFEEIKMHTIYAVKLLDDPYFEIAKNIALYHHENYDGSGYPFKIKGNDIPIEAQIVALADIYDALRSKRSYKKTFSHEEVYKIITEGDGRVEPGHFNPKILEIFKEYHLNIRDIYDGLTSQEDIVNKKSKKFKIYQILKTQSRKGMFL